MAIILFSIAETARSAKSKLTFNMLFLLSVLTIIVNSIALSAILFRISEWGISPNRLAVLGGNILILINSHIDRFNKTFLGYERVYYLFSNLHVNY